MTRFALPLILFVLAGCGLRPPGEAPAAPEVAPSGEVAEGQTRPQARPAAGARTAESFDTSSQAERADAAAPASGGALIGETVASLGDVTREGFWLETPLVDAPAKGRITYRGTGQSAQVQLIPIPGPDGAGSRISLAAMRLIGAPLTDLPRLKVHAGG